jgi:hypothetical protein
MSVPQRWLKMNWMPLPMAHPKSHNKPLFSAFTRPLYLVFGGGWQDLAYGLLGVWVLGPKLQFQGQWPYKTMLSLCDTQGEHSCQRARNQSESEEKAVTDNLSRSHPDLGLGLPELWEICICFWYPVRALWLETKWNHPGMGNCSSLFLQLLACLLTPVIDCSPAQLARISVVSSSRTPPEAQKSLFCFCISLSQDCPGFQTARSLS